MPPCQGVRHRACDENGQPISPHECVLPEPVSLGDEWTCACGDRYVAVRTGRLGRRLKWQRNLFTLPLHVDAPDAEDRDDYDS